ALNRQRDGGRLQHEYAFRRRDGSDLWGLVTSNAIVGPDGTYMGALAMVADLTERKRADAALRVQSAALNAAANAIVITDRRGTIVWINTAFTVLTGYSADEAIGRNPREL